MKLFVNIISVFIVAGVSVQALAVKEGDVYPDKVQISHYEQGAINTASLKGKVTILNFWATWCAACKVEIKEMEADFKSLEANPKFQMAYVALDKDPKKAYEWFKANTKNPSIMMTHLFKDPTFDAANTLEVDSFPMTVIIGPDLKILKIQRGFEEGKGSTMVLKQVAEKALAL